MQNLSYSNNSFSRHCEERLLSRIRNQRSYSNSKNEAATKQSPFVNSFIRVFHIASKKLSITLLEQGDCFAARAELSRVFVKTISQWRLAMTTWRLTIRSERTKWMTNSIGGML